MSVEVGKSYHIKDEFFALVNDDKLMANKESGCFRPHFFFVADTQVEGIYWAIPLSSKVEKYTDLIRRKIEKHGNCDTIVIGRFGNRNGAFLIQNMFPVTAKYVEREHTIGGESVEVHDGLKAIIRSSAYRVLSLHRKGIHLIFPDVDRIYELMKHEIETNP